jgi:hypothetical protein
MRKERIELDAEIANAARWLQEQVENNPYCDAAINLAVHAGNVKRVDYTLSTKLKPAENGGPHNANARHR